MWVLYVWLLPIYSNISSYGHVIWQLHILYAHSALTHIIDIHIIIYVVIYVCMYVAA